MATLFRAGQKLEKSDSRVRSAVELDSMISTVRDPLPHLGEGFVETCLQHYDYRADEVINAILEGNLAPHLAALDQNLPRVAPEVAPPAQPSTTAIQSPRYSLEGALSPSFC